MINTEALRRALAGSIFLDMVAPGWRATVDADRLDIYDARNCVLGQVYADAAGQEYGNTRYSAGGFVWALEHGPLSGENWEAACNLGFMSGEVAEAGHVIGSDLRDAWRLVLAA